ncbi:transglycosylase family protein [Phaeacidiphilus oryzae]|jgi:LysM repeat protein|uniref:transglycosylase family protein n=1 Tax=Phaeacidiphilus oryzae TaxID=348818 RepID=UPI0005658446|nr:transglycosylase family protein [Phaeacidiphilus oryzae]
MHPTAVFGGTGRHRKPRSSHTRRLVATAGVAGAGIAIPLIGTAATSTADAATVSTWDRVAQCESGGDWSINTGNGFYGGLQFTRSTWAAYGGTKYAPTADRASKGQQISVAEKVLSAQGPGAWPVCSQKAGLAAGGSPAQVGTGSGGTTTRHSSASHTHTASSDSVAGHTAPRTVEQPASSSTATRSGSTPTTSSASGGSAVHTVGHGDYVVRSGDTLSRIAAAAHVSGGWRHLYQENRSTVGSNPDLIYPGQRLQVG